MLKNITALSQIEIGRAYKIKLFIMSVKRRISALLYGSGPNKEGADSVKSFLKVID